MGDIFEDLSVQGQATFTAETKRGRDWMGQRYHETTCGYAIANETERAEAERFKKEAAKDGIAVYGL